MPKKIILVESQPEMIDIYRRVLEKTDFDVELACKKSEMLEELRAIRLGESQKPDLILLDFRLQDGHGFEVLKALRKNILTRDIPVFAFTNYQSPELDRQIEAHNAAPDKYLIKTDHTPAQLVNLIHGYLTGAPQPKHRTQLS
jgi:two-component system catabolic regulation response regulator CreB